MKILLVQLSWLGDTILSTPVIAGIKQIYPDSQLWMLTTPLASALVERDPLLAGVLTYDKRNRDSGIKGFVRMSFRLRHLNFNAAYSLHKSYRTAMLLWLSGIPVRIGFANAKLSFLYHKRRPRNTEEHDVLRNLSLISGEISPNAPDGTLRLFAPQIKDANPQVQKVLARLNKYVVLVPGSAWQTKMWPWQGYRQVAENLMAKGYSVVLLGALSERPVSEKVARGIDVINLAGETDISDAMLLVSNSRLVVCNDSMALHMASAFKVPNVAIFCSTSPSFGFGPWQNNAIVLERDDLECKPCGPHGWKRCPTGTEACMRELTPQTVVAAAEKLLGIAGGYQDRQING